MIFVGMGIGDMIVNVPTTIELAEFAIEVMSEYIEGKKIEFKTVDEQDKEWKECLVPLWNWYNFSYRVKMAKPSINWNEVNPEYNYLARDKYNTGILSKHELTLSWDSWESCPPLENIINPCVFSSYDPGTCDWQDSLVKRPCNDTQKSDKNDT